MKSKRLNNLGKINRDKTLNFTWDNKKLSGFEGDSLASALLANNIGIVGRSFKYHRPRGIFSSGVEESGALVTIGSKDRRDPNVRATTQELFDGLKASGQNAFPNVNFDLGGINNYIGRFFAAGFYYKTFMGIPPFEWGKGTTIWMLFEKLIRKAAGMGSASRLPDPDSYEHAHDFCDVIVVGSGPSGVAAAIEAAEKKLDVILVEQDSLVGGNQLSENDFSTSKIFDQLKNEIPENKVLIPGVLDTTSNFVEHSSLVKQRIEKFVNIVGKERVIAGTDCGFGTFAGFGNIDPDVLDKTKKTKWFIAPDFKK